MTVFGVAYLESAYIQPVCLFALLLLAVLLKAIRADKTGDLRGK